MKLSQLESKEKWFVSLFAFVFIDDIQIRPKFEDETPVEEATPGDETPTEEEGTALAEDTQQWGIYIM